MLTAESVLSFGGMARANTATAAQPLTVRHAVVARAMPRGAKLDSLMVRRWPICAIALRQPSMEPMSQSYFKYFRLTFIVSGAVLTNPEQASA